jgi:hypothetical protein
MIAEVMGAVKVLVWLDSDSVPQILLGIVVIKGSKRPATG